MRPVRPQARPPGRASTPRSSPGKRSPTRRTRRSSRTSTCTPATPGEDINWLEDIHLLEEDGIPAVFDRYTNAFLKIYFPIPEGREDEYARKVLIKHLQAGNSYGIRLKYRHAKFPQPELGSWVADSPTVGDNWKPPVLEGWEPPAH